MWDLTWKKLVGNSLTKAKIKIKIETSDQTRANRREGSKQNLKYTISWQKEFP